MRGAHDRKPVGALCPTGDCGYRGFMTKTLSNFTLAAALLLLVAGFGAWAATGARLGWTQTSAVTMQHDEVTGIDYPVRESAFVAGIEVPVGATLAAAAIAAVGVLQRGRATQANA